MGKHNGNSRLHPDVETIITSVIADRYRDHESLAIDSVFEQICACIEAENWFRSGDWLDNPSRSTVARRIRALRTIES